MLVYRSFGAVAQLGERCNRTAEVRGSIPLSSMVGVQGRLPYEFVGSLPLGVTGNTPDSGSGESWFEPRRGNSKARTTSVVPGLLRFFDHRTTYRTNLDACRRRLPGGTLLNLGDACRVKVSAQSGSPLVHPMVHMDPFTDYGPSMQP